MAAIVRQLLFTPSQVTNLTNNHRICVGSLNISALPLSPLTITNLRILSSCLRDNRFLHTLKLSGCGIDDEGVAALCEHFSGNQALECLNLESNLVGTIGVQQLMRTIAKHPTLWELNISNNKSLGLQGLKVIGDELPHINIGILKCESCYGWGPSTSGPDEACQALANGLRQNASLRELHMSYNHVGGVGMKTIAQSLANHPTMESLDLSQNYSLSFEIAVNIGLEVGGLCLKELHLKRTMPFIKERDDNPERCRDAIELLAAGVRINTSLRVLDFSFNSLSPIEGHLLVCAVAEHAYMNRLILTGNSTIGFDGLSRIADELPNLRRLKELCLLYFYPFRGLDAVVQEGMTVTQKADAIRAGQALVRGIKSNFTLFSLRLDFADPDIPPKWKVLIDEYVDEVEFYLKLNSSGRYLMRNDNHDVPTALWPHVLEHNNKNLSHMFYFLSEQPWLVTNNIQS